jgi:hypothetical protein
VPELSLPKAPSAPDAEHGFAAINCMLRVPTIPPTGPTEWSVCFAAQGESKSGAGALGAQERPINYDSRYYDRSHFSLPRG